MTSSSQAAPPLRSVVYAGAYSLEHYMVDAAERTLCGKRPGHINPGFAAGASLPSKYFDDYCKVCFEAAFAHFDLPTPPMWSPR